MTVFLLIFCGIYLYIAWLLLSYQTFKRQRDRIPIRIFVNGIRGKSTVTRYIAAVLREAGYHTFGKTTGSAARILRPDGRDAKFHRPGYPNVNEEIKILKRFSRQKAQATVMECMAINPAYARWLQDKVVQAQINIITNVRYDHPDQMGETLEAIAESLSNTVPENGILITSESTPRLLGILYKKARQKNADVILADKDAVSLKDLEGFWYFTHKDNIAIGYEIARLVNLSQARALKAMQSAPADPGAFQIEFFEFEETTLAWANLFAINDSESFIAVCLQLFQQLSSYDKVVLLNNRYDRPERVTLFTELAQQLQFDRVVALGAYEREVRQIFINNLDKLLELGFSSSFGNAEASTLLRQILAQTEGRKVLLVGACNIHTEQAERLLHLFERIKEREHHSQELSVSAN